MFQLIDFGYWQTYTSRKLALASCTNTLCNMMQMSFRWTTPDLRVDANPQGNDELQSKVQPYVYINIGTCREVLKQVSR
jgi:hypothetical protein